MKNLCKKISKIVHYVRVLIKKRKVQQTFLFANQKKRKVQQTFLFANQKKRKVANISVCQSKKTNKNIHFT
ncbi:MAG: hypothetical protein EAZ97_05890 [Bacteroidetes bacterium]|nr:MAG: hypothetical protein EAZ97_05890 [Bacteroidota bacterium]